jgi:hypothetical protein
MDKRAYIVSHLYGEAEDPAEPGILLEQDETLRREYQALSEVKAHLDRRPRHRPDAQVVDSILTAAGRTPARQDRPPRPFPIGRRVRMAGLISTALALMIAVGIVLWLPGNNRPAGNVAVLQEQAASQAEQAPAVSPAPPPGTQAQSSIALQTAPQAGEGAAADAGFSPEFAPPPQDYAAAGAVSSMAMKAAPEEESIESLMVANEAVQITSGFTDAAGNMAPLVADVLDWDNGSDVRRLHRQVELLEVRSTNWSGDDPLLAPEFFPNQGR